MGGRAAKHFDESQRTPIETPISDDADLADQIASLLARGDSVVIIKAMSQSEEHETHIVPRHHMPTFVLAQ